MDWNNAYSNKNSPLAKRFLENYEQKFHFTTEKNRGNTFISNLLVNEQSTLFHRENPNIDIVVIPLDSPLLPQQKLTIDVTYQLKLPHRKFTGYGFDNDYYHLKYWYLIPAVYQKGWESLSHLDLDDQYHDPTHFEIEVYNINQYKVVSNLTQKKQDSITFLSGTNRRNAELVLTLTTQFEEFQNVPVQVATDLKTFDLDYKLRENILNRQLEFLTQQLGSSKVEKLLITQELYNKYPIYGLNQLPGFLRPFSDTFEWDIRMFQTLTKVFLQENLSVHSRKNAWLQEGLVPYMLMQYVEKYYPENKLIGNIAKIWGVKFYQFAKLQFNDRYLYGYQSIARSNNDQAITTDIDQLSNYNRLVGTRFKTALSLHYLDHYLKDSVVNHALQQFYQSHAVVNQNKQNFEEIIKNHTAKPTDWFFKDFITTNNNIDYQLNKIEKQNDSLQLHYRTTMPNIPVVVTGWKQNIRVSEYWLFPDKKNNELTLPNQNEDTFILNADFTFPEVVLANNWQTTQSKILRKPWQLRWFSDVEDPYKNQIFIEPKVYYNYYDGIIVASDIHNKTFFRKNFYYKVSPSVGFKSGDATGSFSFRYMNYPEQVNINSYTLGISGNYSHYAPELAYKTFSAYASVGFKRKSFRLPEGRGLGISYTLIDKDINPYYYNNPDAVHYGILNVNYTLNRPEIINKMYWSSNWEIGKDFSKWFTDIRFRKLTHTNQQFEVRGFFGFFLYNHSQTDYFSFATNRPSDYLFRYPYFGRSETSGVFSQQFIMNEGGFKAAMPIPYANQWLVSLNTSIGLWRWFEIYTDVGWAKNNNYSVYFLHDKGVRLNFINDYIEVYFPLHSNNGWETASPHYEQKIRFVLTANFNQIWSYIKRGFF